MTITGDDYELVLDALEKTATERWTKIEVEQRSFLETIRFLYETDGDVKTVAKRMGVSEETVYYSADRFARKGAFWSTRPLHCVYSFEDVLFDCLPDAENVAYYYDNFRQFIEKMAIPVDAFCPTGDTPDIKTLRFNEPGKAFVKTVLCGFRCLPICDIVRKDCFPDDGSSFYDTCIEQVCSNFGAVRVDHLIQSTGKGALDKNYDSLIQAVAEETSALRHHLWLHILGATDFSPHCLPGMSRLTTIPDKVRDSMIFIAKDLVTAVDHMILL